MTVCSVCGTSQGPFARDLPKSGTLERVVIADKPYCFDPKRPATDPKKPVNPSVVECLRRRDQRDNP